MATLGVPGILDAVHRNEWDTRGSRCHAWELIGLRGVPFGSMSLMGTTATRMVPFTSLSCRAWARVPLSCMGTNGTWRAPVTSNQCMETNGTRGVPDFFDAMHGK